MEYTTFEVFEIDVQSKAAIIHDTDKVFREEVDQNPTVIADGYEYMPWGADNLMPFHVMNLIETDETLQTCMQFNAEICYGGGFEFNTDECSQTVKKNVKKFARNNSLATYYLGICQDIKHFGFAVSVVFLNAKDEIVKVVRKNACYCRFAPADASGKIPYILYANWRKAISSVKQVEKIELLDDCCPIEDFNVRLGKEIGSDLKKQKRTKARKFAVVTKVPTVDSTYYPIPPYASLFKGKWFAIKQLIGIAKESALKNSAPIKYLVEISDRYFQRIFKDKGITDLAKKKECVREQKKMIIDYLTGVENSGKALFANFYVSPDGKEQHEVKITRLDEKTEGGDWSADMMEAVNMICFAMRVHSNLVGSVPSKSQTNNSGSDKRELYTIAQALQKPYRDVFFSVPYLIIDANKWEDCEPNCPFIQLTTLDENKDAKEVTLDKTK